MYLVHLKVLACFGPYFFFFFDQDDCLDKYLNKLIDFVELWTYSLPYFPLTFLWDTSLQTSKNY